MTSEDGRVWTGHSALAPVLRPVESLKLDPKNARLHPERNIEAIKASLSRFGQVFPILVRGGVVVAGNGRLVAARALAWTHLAALDVDDMTEDEVAAFALMDNKSADLAEWDEAAVLDACRLMPAELVPYTGFQSSDFEALMAEQAQTPEPVPEVKPEKTTKQGFVTFIATVEQAGTIRRAIEAVKNNVGDANVADGRALELLSADFLSGA